MKPTANMRAALKIAKRGPLRRVHNPELAGPPAWPANHATLHALVRHGLVTRQQIKNKRSHRVDVWTITPAGRQALEPVERFREEKPVYLARPNPDISGDYTTDARRGIDEPPVIDPDTLSGAWSQLSAERQAEADTPRGRARRLAQNARARKPGPMTVRHVDPATLKARRAA